MQITLEDSDHSSPALVSSHLHSISSLLRILEVWSLTFSHLMVQRNIIGFNEYSGLSQKEVSFLCRSRSYQRGPADPFQL
jgi:hypothetical protein